jgi:hypothetical protein
MRLPYIFIILPFYLSCSYNIIEHFNLRDFEYPDDKIGMGKTLIFQNNQTNEKTYEDLKLTNVEGKKYRIEKNYANTGTLDSTKRLNGKVVETYNFYLSWDKQVLKGLNIVDTIIGTGKENSLFINKKEFEDNKMSFYTSSETKFLKDTLFLWQNRQFQCIVTQTNAMLKIKSKIEKSEIITYVVLQKTYYGKGIGILKYSVQFTKFDGSKSYNSWDLKDIVDTRN